MQLSFVFWWSIMSPKQRRFFFQCSQFFCFLKSPLSKTWCSNQPCAFSNRELSHIFERCSNSRHKMQRLWFTSRWNFSCITGFISPPVFTGFFSFFQFLLPNLIKLQSFWETLIQFLSIYPWQPFKNGVAFLPSSSSFFLLRVMVNTITLITLSFCFTTEKLDDNHQVVGKYLRN